MRLYTFVATIAVACLMITSVASAASIGVHFPSNRDNARLDPGEMAGVPNVVQVNWNSADGGTDAAANASGDTSNISLPSAGVLTDSNGATVAASVEWTSNGTWNTANGTGSPDSKLMNGYIDAIGADSPFSTVRFSAIPYEIYDVIVYIGSDGNGRTGEVTDGTTTYSYSTFSNDPNGGGGFDPSDYLQTTDTGAAFPDANYAVFSGLTAPDVTIDIIRGSSNSGIHAVQVVDAIPEPSSLILAALGGVFAVGAIARRRRR